MLRLLLKDSGGDLRVSGDSLETASDLETAVIISLFTDRYVEHDEDLPFGETDRRGWCLDFTLPRLPGGSEDSIGSKLWTLQRRKLTSETVALYEQYTAEALQWMVDEGAALSIEVSAERVGDNLVGLSGTIVQEDGGYDWALTVNSETMQTE